MVVQSFRDAFQTYKTMAEGAIDQVGDAGFFATPHSEVNSIAVVVKHIAGNLRSRFRDFLTTDGEKPDRHRDTEFELGGATRAELMDAWEHGWSVLFDALGPLSDDDLEQVIQIRGVDHTVLKALNRALTHYAYHVGQIVLLAKWQVGDDWSTLSVPRGGTEAFNKKYWGRGG